MSGSINCVRRERCRQQFSTWEPGAQCLPSKYAGSGPEVFWLRPVMAVMASYGRFGQRAAGIGPDRVCQIRLSASVSVPFFRRRHGSDRAKPTRIRSGWSGQGFGQTHLVWKQAGVQESSGPVSGRTQPVSHFQTLFRSSTGVPDNIVQNQPGSDLVLANCVRVWPNGSGPDACQCARISGLLTANAFQPIRTGCESDPACLLGGVLDLAWLDLA